MHFDPLLEGFNMECEVKRLGLAICNIYSKAIVGREALCLGVNDVVTGSDTGQDIGTIILCERGFDRAAFSSERHGRVSDRCAGLISDLSHQRPARLIRCEHWWGQRGE